MTTVLLGHSGFIGKSISKIFKDSKNDLIEISSKEVNLISDDSVDSLKNIFSRGFKNIYTEYMISEICLKYYIFLAIG